MRGWTWHPPGLRDSILITAWGLQEGSAGGQAWHLAELGRGLVIPEMPIPSHSDRIPLPGWSESNSELSIFLDFLLWAFSLLLPALKEASNWQQTCPPRGAPEFQWVRAGPCGGEVLAGPHNCHHSAGGRAQGGLPRRTALIAVV